MCYKDLPDSELDNVLVNMPAEESPRNDDENVNFLEEDADALDTEEEETDDYGMFTEMLAQGRKAIVERKRNWEATGDSFILDHFSETMLVNDWVKQNLEDTEANSMDISTLYGDKCKKKKKLQSTFLDKISLPQPKRGTRKSKSVEPLSPIAKKYEQEGPRTPTSVRHHPYASGKSQSESTHDRRVNSETKPKHRRDLLKSVRRLTTVPESPGNVQNGNTLRRAASIGDMKMPRQRTVIYSPLLPIVQEQFKFVLKRESFDPTKMLVYEPPSDANSSSESDDDIFLACKRKFGGKIYEI